MNTYLSDTNQTGAVFSNIGGKLAIQATNPSNVISVNFNADNTYLGFGNYSRFPYPNLWIADSPPPQGVVSGTDITVNLTIPNGTYTNSGLATAITNAYRNYSPSINITVSWNSATSRFNFTKSPVISGDPGLFSFNVSSISSTLGTLPIGVSANPQSSNQLNVSNF